MMIVKRVKRLKMMSTKVRQDGEGTTVMIELMRMKKWIVEEIFCLPRRLDPQ